MKEWRRQASLERTLVTIARRDGDFERVRIVLNMFVSRYDGHAHLGVAFGGRSLFLKAHRTPAVTCFTPGDSRRIWLDLCSSLCTTLHAAASAMCDNVPPEP
jgi:hypothetical protein